MWKKVNGKLVHITDSTRVKFRTNISQSLLSELEELASEHDTRINYLLETGLKALLEDGFISFSKKARPKDRVQYKTTYDRELLNQVRKFAEDHNLFVNDVIEYSSRHIDPGKSKQADYPYRIEL